MFSFYKRHNNKLYNKLVELSRNKFFYDQIKLKDDFETRILLIFFHFSIILKISKKFKDKKYSQDIFDNVFHNIEYHIRELGYGDIAVNNKMKDLNKIFYDILLNLDKEDSFLKKNNTHILKKYFFREKEKNQRENIGKMSIYFKKFHNFCFDLDMNIVLNGSINFKYR